MKLKKIPSDNKGLTKLPKKVRNKMAKKCVKKVQKVRLPQMFLNEPLKLRLRKSKVVPFVCRECEDISSGSF